MNRPPTPPTAPPGTSLGDTFDAAVRSLEDRQEKVKTKPTPINVVHPFLGTSQAFIIQTYRHDTGCDRTGDTILIQAIGAAGSLRIALPPEVSEAIARQRDSLATKSRKRGAQRAMETKAERGIEPPPQFRKRRTTS